MRPDLEELSKAELIEELKRLDRERAHATRGGDAEHERIVHDLEVHQIELEMQNRELRDAHERLAEASEKYRALYDFAPVGYCTLDPEGRIIDINLRAAELLGGPRDELTARSFAALLPRESRMLFADHIARCRRERAAVTSEIVLRGGKHESRVAQMISEPVLDDNGTATAFRTSFVDISALKELERDLVLLSRAGETLAAAMDMGATHGAVGRLAVPALADLCILDVLEAGARIERPLVVIADPAKATLVERFRALADRPGWQSPQRRVIESGEPMLLEAVSEQVRARIAYDDRDAALLRAADIRSLMIVPLAARGRVLGALSLAVAESGRRYHTRDLELARGVASRVAMALDNARLYHEAREASRARDATLAIVAHDLRSPLQTILLRSSGPVVKAEPDAARPPVEALETIHRAAQRMNRLIRDLVDVSSIEAGRLSIDMRRNALDVIVDAAIAAARPMADAKSLRLSRDLVDGERLDVACDRDRIEQVLGNLLGNALKFTRTGGAIVVRGERRGDEVVVSVADDGEGIPPSRIPHVFDRYWQAPETARQGHGLGLAIAKGIVEAHRGRIWVESEVGVGTTFRFSLPCARAEREVSGAFAPLRAPGKTVLVIDDDADLRDVIGERLEHAGFRVAKARDGSDALAYLHREAAPSLILLDLGMSVMDGWEFLVEHERDPALQAIPIVVLSGQRDVAERLAPFHVTCIEKPVAEERLMREVVRAVH